MNKAVTVIPLMHLALMLGPLVVVGYIYGRWVNGAKQVAYASVRMVLQLLGIGFVLTYVFAQQQAWLVGLILIFMLSAAAWIAAQQTKFMREKHLALIWGALFGGCVPILALAVIGVLAAPKWYQPAVVIPLAGMIFANAMNSLSIAIERYENELEKGAVVPARNAAFKASLIPTMNSFLAVGLVSLPGMMTGQILSGVDPLITVRYQIMVMSMVLGGSGIAVALYLHLRPRFISRQNLPDPALG